MPIAVEGEVARPGEYVLPPQSSVADQVRMATNVAPQLWFVTVDTTAMTAFVPPWLSMESTPGKGSRFFFTAKFELAEATLAVPSMDQVNFTK